MAHRSIRIAAYLLVFSACAALGAPPLFSQPQTQETISAASVKAADGLDRFLPKRADAIYNALVSRYSPARAMEIVTFMDRYWRVAGNTGFNASLDRLKSGLVEAGFHDGSTASRSSAAWLDEYPNGGNGWEPVRAEMTIVSASSGTVPEAVFDPVIDYIAVCINSFSTPPEGAVARLVYVGKGTDAASYEGVDVKGAVVLGDGGMRGLWMQAVKQRGAIGVISGALAPGFTRPDQTPEVFQWGSVPYDETAKAFGFNASHKVADRLKERLRAGPVSVRTTIETRFRPGSPGRFLVAEIPGRTAPEQRVVMVAHVQEPGANDDASGCGTLYELARSLQAAVAGGTLPPPARTLTFIWGDEMRVSREWLRADAARATNVRYMISFDMTGEDTTKTGGSFLIEKEPDPSAVWPRPSDPHSEWWSVGDNYRAEALNGSLLNDLVLAVCLRRARDTGWNVQTNPYEGGSDHSIFLQARIPALLAQHFTDRYYHTNLDRPDKTSPAEMGHVGISMGTAAMVLASAGDEDALALVELVAAAAERRLALEAKQGADAAILDAWRTWYRKALESVLQLPAAGPTERLKARVTAAASRVMAGGGK
jgi:aminopeptidase YwaD